MSKIDLIAKVNREIDQGCFWRAKEILRSSFGRYGYEPELFTLYGQILLAMHDDMQAGRYLFYGVEHPNDHEQSAIDLFIARHSGKDDHMGLLINAPMRYESAVLNLPAFVEARLSPFGLTEKLNKIKKYSGDVHPNNRWHSCGCGLMALFLAASLGVGVVTILRWLF